MIEVDKSPPKKHNYLIRWVLRLFISFFLLVIILSVTIQIPFIQKHLLDYATDYVTTNFGISVEIESVELHPILGDLSLNGITYTTDEVSINLESINLFHFKISEGWQIILKSVELEGLHVNTESLEDLNTFIENLSSSENLNKGNGKSTFIEHFELSNSTWMIGDSLNGSLELIALDSIEFLPSTMGRKSKIIIGEFDLSMLKTNILLKDLGSEKTKENITVINSLGRISINDNILIAQVKQFDAVGMQFNGLIEIDLNQNKDIEVGGLTFIPNLDINVTVKPSFYAKWGGDEIVDIVSRLQTDEIKGKIVIKNGVVHLENFTNPQFLIKGEVNEKERKWSVGINIDLDIVKPLIDKLNLNNEAFTAYVDDLKSIQINGYGGINNVKGDISLHYLEEKVRSRDKSIVKVNYDLVFEEGNWENGVSCSITIDSLKGKYGIIQDLIGNIEIKDDVAEVKWENEILNAQVYSEGLQLYSHLNGYALIDYARLNKTEIKSRLNFRNSIVMSDNQPPISFERFDISVNIKNNQHIEFEIESDLIIGEGFVNLEMDTWTSWIDRSIMRAQKEDGDIKGTILTRGNCEILRAKPIATILGITASASKGTSINWMITDDYSEIKAYSEWLRYNEFTLKGITFNMDGKTEENWINIEVLDVLKSDEVIGAEFNMDVHADTVWTTDFGWKNTDGIEGLIRIEGSLEKEALWNFNVYEATIPLGLDTLELTRIPSPIVISKTEISSEGMSWKGGGFQAEIDGEIGGIGDKQLNFLIHTEKIDSNRTKLWFNVPISADNISIFGSLGGTLLSPSLTFSGLSEGLSYAGETIPNSVFKITYLEDELLVDFNFSGLGDEASGEIITRGTIKNITSGDYTLDMMSSLTNFPLSWTNAILDKKTAKLGGQLDADLTIKGKLTSPTLLGSGTLKNALVGIAYLGTEYNVTGGFGVTPYGIELNGLQVKDGKGGEGFLVGTALHENFNKWNLDISLSFENEDAPLELMNISKSPDAYFYGTGNAWGDVNIFGYDDQITIEARVKTTKGTEFVLPMDAASNSTWSSFVNIVNHDDDVNDHSNFNSSENDAKTSIKLDLIIDVTDESIARIVFDEVVGDEIIGRCNGVMHIAIDDFERLAMFGSLEVVEGEYLFTLSNFINKKFIAEPGGTIKWFGDPYKAEIDLRTYYSTRTSLRPISPEISDNTKQRVDLILEMDGDLLRPGIKFDIILPEGDARTRATLASLIANEEEMNRQAISLLVLQQFLPAQWQASAIGSTGLQENSTELISAQLGNWLSGISDDVNIGIDYDASNNIGNEAALAVALSTQLLNDRLHVEGEVGTQHLNTGSIQDLQVRDFRLRYDIKDDGSLQLTGYSTQRATIPGLEGESVQGVGIVYHRDFESLKDLFKRQEK